MKLTGKGRSILSRLLWSFQSSIIITLHHLSENPLRPQSGCRVQTELFYRIIKEYDRYIALPDLISQKSCGPGIALTFDDGLEDIYTIGYPFLKSREIPFTLFIVYEFLDQPGYLTKEQLLEMAGDPLVTIGVHGMTHQTLTGLTFEEKRIEILDAKGKLETLLERKLEYFAYSHGQYDKECLKLVKKAGYKAAFTVQYRPYNIVTKHKRMRLPRFSLEQKNTDDISRAIKRLDGN